VNIYILIKWNEKNAFIYYHELRILVKIYLFSLKNK
jgi:hypothetical protein